MPFTKMDLNGSFLFEPVILEDVRGYFFESYNEEVFFSNAVKSRFLQDNQSNSKKGVIRGLHYQLEPFAQSKLVRVLQGTIFDVIVDIRKGSPDFGKWIGVELSSENKKQLYVPKGFAHGFSVISDTAEVLYKCDQFYHRESEAGIRFDDPQLGIDWRIKKDHEIVSSKDLQLPSFMEGKNNFQFTPE
jgi:dTDP-4-dehydrorhamnose 3,5-epimerase